jgi:hypothetical protein
MLHSAVPQACTPRDLARPDPAARASLLRSARSSTRPRQGVCRRRATVARGAALAVKRERGRADPAQLNSSQRWRIAAATRFELNSPLQQGASSYLAHSRHPGCSPSIGARREHAPPRPHRTRTAPAGACSSAPAALQLCLSLSPPATGHRCPIRRVDRLEQDVNRPRQRKSNSGMF